MGEDDTSDERITLKVREETFISLANIKEDNYEHANWDGVLQDLADAYRENKRLREEVEELRQETVVSKEDMREVVREELEALRR